MCFYVQSQTPGFFVFATLQTHVRGFLWVPHGPGFQNRQIHRDRQEVRGLLQGGEGRGSDDHRPVFLLLSFFNVSKHISLIKLLNE